MSDKPFQPHPEYEKYAPQWQRCRDTTEGQDAVKKHDALYLPRLEGSVNTISSNTYASDYTAYKDRALFYGAMGRTVIGLTGAVMRKAPIVTGVLPPEDDKDIALPLVPVGFAGETLLAMIHGTVKDVLEVGRIGHLVDAASEEDTNGALVPYVVAYEAEDIISWHEKIVDGRKKLVLIILREMKTIPNPMEGMRMDTVVTYRVLRLVDKVPVDDNGDMRAPFLPQDLENGAFYIQELWATQEGKKELILVDTKVPRSRTGTFNQIPFRFSNWDGSAPSVSKPPLVDLANVNISHYQNSADIEHGRHYVALPTPWATGFDLPKGEFLRIGSKTAWVTQDTGGSVGMLEFTGAGLGHLADGMIAKESMMAVLGARLLEESRPGVEAAETVKIRQSGDRSVLAGIAQSVSGSWSWILNFMHDWANIIPPTEPITVSINTDFVSSMMDPQMLTALVATLQTNNISWPTFVELLQRGEIISDKITAEDEAERIAEGLPSGSLGSANDNDPFPDPKPPSTRRRVRDVVEDDKVPDGVEE